MTTRFVLARVAWAAAGIVFVAPLGLVIESGRRGVNPGTWLGTALVLVLGCVVGTAFPLRMRVGGFPGRVFRLVLLSLVGFVAFLWLGFAFRSVLVGTATIPG